MLKTVPKGKTVIEYMPLRDYYHRHSRALFWELQVRVNYETFIISHIRYFNLDTHFL